ncbi:hypothetical protein HIM_05783 [Hirsutella minnesotensis 3608]|uniref:IMD domain-containing protein n=1 Tax=Hirsutella minnesotensis 3608 TaxID=1043627 RepID=A0A0F8A582_9HYPO|nr:hypothetical protein HIM_05783 [Hirsutella minnesotensis 3608]
MASRRDDDASSSRPATPTPSQLPPVPGSPVYSIASTANNVSHFNLPLPPAPRPSHAVLKRADLDRSHDAYADLVASAKTYRLALADLSAAASSFASALEACARLKEARAEPIGPPAGRPGSGSCTADPLLSASGVHHLIANHQQILSETVYRSFEVPLLHDLDKWRSVIEDEDLSYQHNIKAQSREVKRLEKEGLKLHRQRRRDVARFRAHLVDLTAKLDGLTTLHADHAGTLLRESQDTSARIADASCSLVRAEVDIFESLARKGWSGGGLEDLLDKGQDLFATDDAAGAGAASTPGEPAKLFSILPPKSILADSASDVSRSAHDRQDTFLPANPDRLRSFAASSSTGSVTNDSRATTASTASTSSTGTVTAVDPKSSAADVDTFAAESMPPPPPRHHPRPFSPQPIRRIPTDVTFESLGALAAPAPLDRTHASFPQAPGSDAQDSERNDDGTHVHSRQDAEDTDAVETPEERGRKRSPSPWASRHASSPGPTSDTDAQDG